MSWSVVSVQLLVATKARGEAALLMCVSKHGKFDVPTILAEKSAQAKDYGLELHNPDPDEQVGGMQVFQEYVEEEVACSTPKHSDMVCKATVCQSLLDHPVLVSLWE